MSATSGTYDSDPVKARQAAEELRSVAGAPGKMVDDFQQESRFYDGWNGQEGVVDQFKQQTEPDWTGAKDAPVTFLNAIGGAVSALSLAVLKQVESIDGTKGLADDLIHDATSDTESLDLSDDSGSGSDGGTGGGKH